MKFLSVLFLVLISFSFAANSEEEYATDIPSRFEHSYLHYYINDDGTHVETIDWAYTVLKESALKRGKKYSFSYSTSVEKAEVVEAYTEKPDGKRIEVPKSNYQVSVNSGKGKNSPLFSDRTRMSVVFPEAEVGDTFYFKFKVIQTQPIFPGHISLSRSYYRTTQDNDVQVTINAPASLWAQYEGRQMKEEVVERDGRKIIKWTYQNKKPIKRKRKNWSVFYRDKHPGFTYSTFKDYEEVAKAYAVRALPKAVPTDRVKKLAMEIIKDESDARDKAKALYEWVATNITYAGHCVGVGTVVPHDTNVVLDNRMGDCKDQTTLLQALLKAVGIESTQALMNARSYYTLPRIPTVSAVNHVIAYIPGMDLYLDPTASTTPFAHLPFDAQDKDVLLVENYQTGLRTPAVEYKSNQEKVINHIKIKPDGSVSGEMKVDMKGSFAIRSRSQMRNVTVEMQDQIMEQVIRSMGYIGKGSFEMEDARALSDTYSYSLKVDLENYIQRPGAGAFNVRTLFPTGGSIEGILTQALSYDEENEMTCMGGVFSEEYIYEFPEDMKILATPDDLELKNDFLTYRSSYKREGSVLNIKRVIEDRTKGNICSPEISKKYKKIAAEALKNVKAQVVYM